MALRGRLSAMQDYTISPGMYARRHKGWAYAEIMPLPYLAFVIVRGVVVVVRVFYECVRSGVVDSVVGLSVALIGSRTRYSSFDSPL